MSELHDLSAVALRELLQSGDVSPSEVTDHYLARIDAANETLHAFTYLDPQRSREVAASLDMQLLDGKAPSRLSKPLWGLPFADKDLSDRAQVPTTYGSRAFDGYIPSESSPLTEDLDAAGGISVGKTNVPELGFPPYSKNMLPGGYARNPWDAALDPGGSSSGAATAVSARLLPLAPGSDAGGSVRIPALATGLVGLKPTRGRVPGESGVATLAGLAVGGPLARSVEDTALLFDAMVAGPHRYTLRAPVQKGLVDSGSYLDSLASGPGNLKIGWTTWSPWATHYDMNVDAQAMGVFEDALAMAQTFGHEVEEVSHGTYPDFVEAFRAVWMAGAAGLPLPDEALDALEPLTAWLVRTGRTRPASDLPRALAALSAFEAQVIADFAPYDVVFTPGLAQTPRPFDWFNEEDGEASFEQQTQFTPFTAVANVSGLPAIALPLGQGTSEVTGATVPIGFQAIGRGGDELTLLRLGKQYEDEVSWQDRIPSLA